MLFKDIPGLDEVKARLIHAAQVGQVAHAQLFLGRAGSPNLPMALAYAAYLNCEDKKTDDACGLCPACSKNLKYIHPDVHFAFPVSATAKVKIKDALSVKFLPDWRKFLLERPFGDVVTWADFYGGEDKQVNISKEESRQIIKSLSLKAFEGEYKVMLIWLPEYLHPAAANAILKILEEPPEKTVFLLVSNSPERLLATILSRTQLIHIPAFTDATIAGMLKERESVEEKKAAELAHLANGDYNLAVKLAGSLENDNHALFTQWMRDCFKRDFTALVSTADNFHAFNKVAQRSLFQYALNMLREALIIQSAPSIKRISEAENTFINNFSKQLDISKVERISDLISDAHYHLERNASPKITFLDLSLHIARTFS